MKSLTWTKGLTEDEKKELKADFLSSQVLRKRMAKIIEDEIESERNALELRVNYDQSPNWALDHADRIGYIRAMKKIKSLLF